jgi:hypothetical protein
MTKSAEVTNKSIFTALYLATGISIKKIVAASNIGESVSFIKYKKTKNRMNPAVIRK